MFLGGEMRVGGKNLPVVEEVKATKDNNQIGEKVGIFKMYDLRYTLTC